MKFCTLLLLTVFAGPAYAGPVHVALKSAAAVQPNADGFISLASIADLTGGEKATRIRFASIPVGRAPLSGEIRLLTRGDIALKLRQAGCDPDKEAVLEGAPQTNVTTADAPPAPNNGGAGKIVSLMVSAPVPFPTAPPLLGAGGASPLVHRGDAVTIVIQSGGLTITALGVARENGGAGDSIRVHREGVMTDLPVQVLDAKTVQLEI